MSCPPPHPAAGPDARRQPTSAPDIRWERTPSVVERSGAIDSANHERRRVPGGVEITWSGPKALGQWEQERAVPASSAVRKLEPQPQPDTAFGLLTVKPAPMRVST